jgi:putative SOS response-associated peptidase YedK
MCGRFTQNYTWQEVHAFLSVFGPPRNLRPRYNIAPTTTVDVIRLGKHGGRELVSMRWGLIPFWWKKTAKEMPATFNARAESVAEKPMFRTAFKERRCIIPASGFFEWTGEKGNKQPHLFTAADGSPVLAFAGLWDKWRDPMSGDEILSCTIIVCGGNKWMETYHDRMPVMLVEKNFDAWLDGSLGPEALTCATESALREWPVSKRMNKTGEGDDDPTIIERISGIADARELS